MVGAGAEGLKKINSLLTQECEILLVSRESNPKVEKYLKDGAIKFLQADLQDAKFLLEYNPILVMATTDDHALNRTIVNEARKIPGCMAYASDDPESSDFSHPSVINIKERPLFADSKPLTFSNMQHDGFLYFKILISSVNNVPSSSFIPNLGGFCAKIENG